MLANLCMVFLLAIWRNRTLKVGTLRMLFVSIVRCHLVGALECYALTKPEAAELDLEIVLRSNQTISTAQGFC
jgi:hypothetical protein